MGKKLTNKQRDICERVAVNLRVSPTSVETIVGEFLAEQSSRSGESIVEKRAKEPEKVTPKGKGK